jgi:hypothetical protein
MPPLDRAADILEHVDFTPAALRADLTGRVWTGLLYSAAEIMSHAADLRSDSAGLVHDNERRWRAFRHRVGQVLAAQDGTQGQDSWTARAEGPAAPWIGQGGLTRSAGRPLANAAVMTERLPLRRKDYDGE